MTDRDGAIVLNLLAATEGGQVTRARSFLERLHRFDPKTRYVVLKARGSLPFCLSNEQLDVREVSIGKAGVLRVLRRTAWENMFIPPLMRSAGARAYLTFSHYLPSTFPSTWTSVVGVSNLAPFSKEAWDAEVSLARRLKMQLLRRTIVSSARRASAVIALSDTCRHELQRQGIDEARIAVISNGVSPPPGPGQYPALLRTLGVGGRYLLSVSHFHRYKNFERLVEAYAMLPAGLRECFPLVIIGKPIDREYFLQTVRLVAKCGLADRVHIVPGIDQSDLYPLYHRASLFVFPSLVENSPNILLEAMACAVPVICGRIPPMPEFGGDAALYFDPLSTRDIACRIEQTLRDEGLLSTMRARAPLQAAKYTWDDFTAGVVSTCARACRSRCPRPKND